MHANRKAAAIQNWTVVLRMSVLPEVSTKPGHHRHYSKTTFFRRHRYLQRGASPDRKSGLAAWLGLLSVSGNWGGYGLRGLAIKALGSIC